MGAIDDISGEALARRTTSRACRPTVEVPLKSVPQAFDEATERDPAARRGGVLRPLDQLPRAARGRPTASPARSRRSGVKKGDRVALYLLNSPQFIIAYFAALKCGATVTPISPVYTSHEVRYQLAGQRRARGRSARTSSTRRWRKSGATLDLVVVTNVGEYLPALKRLFGKKARRPGGGKRALAAGPAEEAPAAAARGRRSIRKTDLAALPYTGGTTGNPKGVMLTHYNLIAAQTMGQAAFPVFEPGKEVILAFLPFFHIYGQVVIMLNGLCQGNLLVLFTSPDTEAILAAMERYQRHGVLRRADALRVPEGPQGHQQGGLEAAEAGALGRRHAARIDHEGLGEAHRLEHHRGLRPVGDLRRPATSIRCTGRRPARSAARSRACRPR